MEEKINEIKRLLYYARSATTIIPTRATARAIENLAEAIERVVELLGSDKPKGESES